MTETSTPNPYSPPTTISDRPLRLQRTQSSSLRRLCLVQCGIIVIALAAEVYDIETIMGSGPILAIMGLGIALVAYRQGDLQSIAFGLSGTTFATFVFLLIFVMNWGPSAADEPVQWLSLGYALCALPAAGWLLYRRHDVHESDTEDPYLVTDDPPAVVE